MAYNLGPVKAHVRAIAESVGPRFGIVVIYGFRPVDPFPDHPSGRALDWMTSSQATRHALAEYLRTNAVALDVDYIIRDRQVWSYRRAAEGWRPYSGSNPHTDHVHSTHWATSGGSDITQLGLGGTTQLGVGQYVETLGKLGKVGDLLSDPQTWMRVAWFLGGVVLVGIALLGISGMKDKVGQVANLATMGKASKVMK